jgi:hypothetical protein
MVAGPYDKTRHFRAYSQVAIFSSYLFASSLNDILQISP